MRDSFIMASNVKGAFAAAQVKEEATKLSNRAHPAGFRMYYIFYRRFGGP